MCLASCGPVVAPWLLAQPGGVGTHSRQLGLFLAARLAGYLLFAAAAWGAASAISRSWLSRPWLMGSTEILLAAALLFYAAGLRVPHGSLGWMGAAGCLVQIGEPAPARRSGAAVLGFLTGINLCPPFLVAGMRAAQLASLGLALVFFVCFFVGTSIWFAPFLSLGLLRRSPAVVSVGRMVAVLLACWYGVSGVSMLVAGAIHD